MPIDVPLRGGPGEPVVGRRLTEVRDVSTIEMTRCVKDAEAIRVEPAVPPSGASLAAGVCAEETP